MIISKKIKKDAIDFLNEKLSKEEKDKILGIYIKNKEKGVFWFIEYHFSYGMYIRNLLRNGGFTDDKFGGNLDDHYSELLRCVIDKNKKEVL